MDPAGAPFYRILQMWPIGCFVWIALAVNVVRALAPHVERRLGDRRSVVRAVWLAAAAGVLVIVPVATAFADSARPDDKRAAQSQHQCQRNLSGNHNASANDTRRR